MFSSPAAETLASSGCGTCSYGGSAAGNLRDASEQRSDGRGAGAARSVCAPEFTLVSAPSCSATTNIGAAMARGAAGHPGGQRRAEARGYAAKNRPQPGLSPGVLMQIRSRSCRRVSHRRGLVGRSLGTLGAGQPTQAPPPGCSARANGIDLCCEFS